MFEKRKTTLQQPEITRSFVTIPTDFIKNSCGLKNKSFI